MLLRTVSWGVGAEAASSFLLRACVHTYYHMHRNRYTQAHVNSLSDYYEVGTVLSALCMLFHP